MDLSADYSEDVFMRSAWAGVSKWASLRLNKKYNRDENQEAHFGR